MRYTTIIDISELPAIYKNKHTRLLYIHMAMKAGYHDDDRDILDCSIRRLAAAAGLSISATRHALAVLERAGLVTRDCSRWRVKKFVLEQKITARRQSNTAAAGPSTTTSYEAQAAETEQKALERELIRQERARLADEWFKKAGRPELSEALQALEAGKTFRSGAVIISPTARAIEAIRSKLATL